MDSDFEPQDLGVARVIEAREPPNTDRLILLHIDLGDEERQLVAGIAGKIVPGAWGRDGPFFCSVRPKP